jgi:hypothetical protein
MVLGVSVALQPRFGELVDALWTIAERLVPLKISTFDRLGENSRAVNILEARLGR